jgi:hypothetical protein
VKRKSKKTLKKVQEEYYDSIPESELNATHKEDFEKVLSALVPRIKPIPRKKSKKK